MRSNHGKWDKELFVVSSCVLCAFLSFLCVLVSLSVTADIKRGKVEHRHDCPPCHVVCELGSTPSHGMAPVKDDSDKVSHPLKKGGIGDKDVPMRPKKSDFCDKANSIYEEDLGCVPLTPFEVEIRKRAKDM